MRRRLSPLRRASGFFAARGAGRATRPRPRCVAPRPLELRVSTAVSSRPQTRSIVAATVVAPRPSVPTRDGVRRTIVPPPGSLWLCVAPAFDPRHGPLRLRVRLSVTHGPFGFASRPRSSHSTRFRLSRRRSKCRDRPPPSPSGFASRERPRATAPSASRRGFRSSRARRPQASRHGRGRRCTTVTSTRDVRTAIVPLPGIPLALRRAGDAVARWREFPRRAAPAFCASLFTHPLDDAALAHVARQPTVDRLSDPRWSPRSRTVARRDWRRRHSWRESPAPPGATSVPPRGACAAAAASVGVSVSGSRDEGDRRPLGLAGMIRRDGAFHEAKSEAASSGPRRARSSRPEWCA